ncbi:unnamed protein product [Thelazia callipaeda]|uniref:Threonylcarbamoyladenosine tRNA methylthiotransferase n=1 Tax=Thelazia callipaeda TaxID=103827 RepID=A0A0N5CVR7_THECL|nr:unnamed protein product [Thelazia callipaeda]
MGDRGAATIKAGNQDWSEHLIGLSGNNGEIFCDSLLPGDIEDAISDSSATRNCSQRDRIIIRRRLRESNEVFCGDSFVPGTQKIYLKTWGCTHNTSDSEQMAGLLNAAGYQLTDQKNDASLWILNSCTVKTPSETQFENMIKEARNLNKFVIAAGCVSQAEPNLRFLDGITIIGVKQIEYIVMAVEETLQGNCVRFLSRRRPDLNQLLPKIRKNKFVEVDVFNFGMFNASALTFSGCLNHCTYCKTKSSRGNLVSFPPENLLQRVRNALKDGCKEIWLTSEDLGAWGRDINMVLPDLLYAVVEIIPEGCMLRLGMTNPPYILDYLELQNLNGKFKDIAKILNHPKVYAFLHIPVQAASDAVLSDMKREYTSADFCRVVDYMIQNVPNVYIATDFICAYPTETEDDFEESMSLVRKYRFPSLFINQFYPRIGTPAAKLKKIDTAEARRRTAEMSGLFRSYSRYGKDRIGEKHSVLVCEMATDGKHYVGHNKYYEHFLIASENCLLGRWVEVRITDVSKFYMRALPTGCSTEKNDWWLCDNAKGSFPALSYNCWFASFVFGSDDLTVAPNRLFWLMRKNNGERVRDAEGFRLRAAGICTRGEGSSREILIITGGKDDGRWIIPGGGIEKNENDSDAALREVLEEAGVKAEILTRDEERRNRTAVFLLTVIEELKEWEDSCFGRQREWVSLEEALRRVKRSQTCIIEHICQM